MQCVSLSLTMKLFVFENVVLQVVIFLNAGSHQLLSIANALDIQNLRISLYMYRSCIALFYRKRLPQQQRDR
jgi:hypothetical protein